MFASNTGISTSHNYFVRLNRGETRTFRIWLRPEEAGRLKWRFTYTNTVFSTWDNGAESRADMPGGRFEIVSASVAAADAQGRIGLFKQVNWPVRVVEPNACVTSRETETELAADGYLVFGWCLRALEEDCRLPSTPDSQALCRTAPGDAVFAEAGAFTDDQNTVMPEMFAAGRDVHTRMVFMGDSITQGCGTRIDHYEQWATRIAMGMEKDVSVWNIGLGYGRGGDAARGGVWLKNAAQGDIVNVCFGVNDIFQTWDEALLIRNLAETVTLLKARGARVVLFTIPPFDMEGEYEAMWRHTVERIREDGLGADAVFDIARILSLPAPDDHRAAYGGHPDGRGGAAVAAEYLDHFWPEWRDRLMAKKR